MEYWREDLDGVIRTKNGKAQTYNYGMNAWKDFDYKADGYLTIGDPSWCWDFKSISEEEARRIIKQNSK